MAESAVELMSEGVLCLLPGCFCSQWYVRCVPFLYVINQTVADHDMQGWGPPQHEMRRLRRKKGIIIFCET